MIKLYRANPEDPTQVDYWEGWQSEPRLLTLHQGTIGDIGLTAQVRVPRFKSPEKVLEAEAAEARADGFEAKDPDDLVQVVIQFAMDLSDDADPEADLARVVAAEELCDEVLGWTGNGHCDGHDIGAGTMNLFTETVLPDIAVRSMAEALAQAEETELVIAIRTGDDFRVAWPEDHPVPFHY